MIRKCISLKNKSGEDIILDLCYDEGTREAPTILILHGFKGFKDWGFFPDLSRAFTRSSYVTLCLNFSRNGIGPDPQRFTELEKFAENTYSHELDDVAAVLKAIKSEQIGKRIINPERIGLLGHSRGGAMALLTALENKTDIKAVVTWSAISHLNRFSPEQIEQWNNDGYIEVENSRTKQMMRLNKSFWDDLNKHKKRFDLLKKIENLEAPALFIHGSEDTSTPPSESETLYENCGSTSKRLEIIEGANHTFGVKHPFESRTPHYETVYDLTEYWFDSHLNI